MKRRNRLTYCGLIALLIGLLMSAPAFCQWQQILLPGGAVGEDLCKVQVGNSDVVWAASMGSGLYRMAWSNSAYGDWSENIPGKGFLGVDAIYQGGTEYVLGAGTGFGAWYGYSTNGTISNWGRPGGDDYPHATSNDWRNARLHDAAFWFYGSSYATTPSNEYIVLLAANLTGYNRGIYKWDYSNFEFDRVDEASGGSRERGCSRIWRDYDNANILYVQGENPDLTVENPCTAMYRLKNSYNNMIFQPFDIAYMYGRSLPTPSSTYQTVQFYGMSQWKYDYDSNLYTYVLLKYHENSGGTLKYGIFATTVLPIIACQDSVEMYDVTRVLDNIDIDPVMTDNDLIRWQYDGKIVGRPYLNGQQVIKHRVWFTDPKKGALYYDEGVGGSPTQIVGSTDLTTTPTLRRWAPHAMIPDFQSHITANSDKMRLLDGTQHGGIFYMTHAATGDPTWSQMVNGLYGTQMRSINVFQSGGGPNVLVPTMNQGIKLYKESGWESIGHGVSPNIPATDPTFQKGITQARHWTADNSYDYWFNGGLYGEDFIGTNSVTHGGLYATKTANTLGDVVRIDFDNSANSNKYFVNRIKNGIEGSNQYLYIGTGFVGPENSFNHDVDHINIVNQYRNDGGWGWHRIYTSAEPNDPGLGILAVESDPLSGGHVVYVGRGNFYNWGVSYPYNIDYFARIDSLHYVANSTWDRSSVGNIYQASGTGYEKTSVYDISAIEDPSPSGNGKYLMFFGMGKMNAADDASAYWDQGTVYMRRWTGSIYENSPLYTYTHSTTTLDGIAWTKSPAGMSVEAFTFDGRPYLVALLSGVREVTSTNLYPIQTRVYLYDLINDHWTDLGMPLQYQDSDIYPQMFDVTVDQANGYDIYTTAYGRVLKLDFNAQSNMTSTNVWHWISFNQRDLQDSLKYMFGDQSKISEIKDMFRHSYKPNASPKVDQIGVWNWLQSYSVKTSSADTLRVLGVKIPSDTLITLYPAPQDSAWIYNGLAYLPDDTLNVNDAFLADSDYVLIVKNDQGQFWSPGDGPDFDMVPGEGYQIGVNDTLEYQYPVGQGSNSFTLPPGAKNQNQTVNSLTSSHFQYISCTGDYYAIYIDELMVNGEPPSTGDEVGVYTPQNLCVGAGVYEGAFPIKIAAWKDDPTTEVIDGYASGEMLSFKFFDASANVEIPLDMQMVGVYSGDQKGQPNNHFEQGYYARHALSGSYILPGSYRLAQNFPNPFNPATTVRYDLPYDSHVTLEIFDLAGRKVMTLVDGVQSAGFRAMRWEGKNQQGADLASGVYFCRIKAEATQQHFGKLDKFERTLKMVMVK
jgi:hypothetical protein